MSSCCMPWHPMFEKQSYATVEEYSDTFLFSEQSPYDGGTECKTGSIILCICTRWVLWLNDHEMLQFHEFINSHGFLWSMLHAWPFLLLLLFSLGIVQKLFVYFVLFFCSYPTVAFHILRFRVKNVALFSILWQSHEKGKESGKSRVLRSTPFSERITNCMNLKQCPSILALVLALLLWDSGLSSINWISKNY